MPVTYDLCMPISAAELVELSEVRAFARSGAARAIRLAAQVSLSELAEAAGVSLSTIHKWEAGERVPRGQAALRYKRLLDQLAELRHQAKHPLASPALVEGSGET